VSGERGDERRGVYPLPSEDGMADQARSVPMRLAECLAGCGVVG